MDYQETKAKVLKLCDNLAAQGLMSKAEQAECQRAYVQVGASADDGTFPEAKTSSEHSFGMIGEQGRNPIGQDLARKKQFKAYIRSSQGIRVTNRAGDTALDDGGSITGRYLSVRNGGVLYMESLTPAELINQPADTSGGMRQVFTVQIQVNGHYSIMNDATGNYVKISAGAGGGDGTVVTADTNNLTESTYWKLITKSVGKVYAFESVARPGFYLTAGIPVTITKGQSPAQNWTLDRLSDELDSETAQSEFEASNGRTLANKLLADVAEIRLRYYSILAKIGFLEMLRNKILNMTKRDGDIMSYYYDLRANRSIQMSDELLQSISVSVDSEIRNREILKLDDEIRELALESERLEGTELADSSRTVQKLNGVIDRLINDKKNQIASVNLIMEKINAKQLDLNEEEDNVVSRQKYQATKGVVNNVNTQISDMKSRDYQKEYWFLIGLYVLTGIAILFFAVKLYRRYSVYA
jgi:hypothetical protein